MGKNRIKTALVSLYCLESLGIISISSYLLSKGKDVINIFLRDMPRSPDEFLDQRQINKFIGFLKKEDIDIVGISFISTFYKEAIELSKAIKESSNIKTIFGGYHASLCPEECIPYGDMVCIGEGEYTLLEIIERMETGDSLDSIKGIWYKDGERIIKNETRPLINDLDGIYSTLDFEKMKTYLYLSYDDMPLKSNQQESYHTIAAKGCPFTCSYCNSSSMHRIADHNSKFFRKRSVDNLIAELIKAKEFYPCIKAVHLHNEVFPYYNDELDEFCIKYKKNIGLPFTAFFHFNFLNEKTINKLKEAGLSRLSLGLQSGSEKFRREVYNRMETNRKILEVRDCAIKSGLPLSFDIILSPLLETRESLKEAISFYLDLGESVFL
ncbi:MAG: radical SAM protein, partial [Candidatus Omnitrophica bacterium]|nr:radical SAM protein [Candidatus Omnitrophota bacterium]